MRRGIVFIAMALTAGASIAAAQMIRSGHGGAGAGDYAHSTTAPDDISGDAILKEPGQGAFAALAEVVRVLEADPATDWTVVDFAALRDHLVDMDRLVTRAVVTETDVAGGISAFATGDADTLASVLRMVPAHAAQLSTDPRWTVKVTAAAEGVALRVTSGDPATTARIRGLGFFGLMASQDHHRAHHLAMASGKDVHRH
ncbi:hypothetical protein [Roseobacter ponti]|uniref:Uncharacterized protein n=1 Tax=Roseobacter ponti TaxID=1891787 RepID=A0A858SRE7_9RHOB|nr:hypothetical protein [Roseobacter ponti]QJF50412.1 hypothetical protein G3256_04155 [Roseobacter ponti]